MIKHAYKKFFIYITLITLVAMFLPHCATASTNYKRGLHYYETGEYDRAVKSLETALKEKPSQHVRTNLFRAKLSAYFQHLALARSLRDQNKQDEALKEYEIALKLYPDNKPLMEEIAAYTGKKKEIEKPFQSTIIPPVMLKVDPKEKIDLKLQNTPITRIFKVVGKSFGINFIFDKDFRDFVYNLEVEKISFYEVLSQLCMIGAADYRILDQSTILIFPDSTFKKRTFGLRGTKVFHLANVRAEEAKKILMTVFREEQIMVQEDNNLNTLIVKADFSTLVEIERFLFSTDKAKSEVVIDVQIMEVTKNILKNFGPNFGDVSSAFTTVTAGTLGTSTSTSGTSATTLNTNVNVNNLKDTSFFITIPSAAISFLESDDKSRLIAKPNLRGVDGEEIKFMVGDEVPVPQTQFQSYTPGGVNNVPVTTYQYKNVGVEVKITPYVHSENEVTLKVKLTINSIAGYENNFPIFGKRELENIIRLKEGETNIIGGFIRDEVRGGLKGLFGFSKIPILGRLFGASSKTVKQTDLIFSVTPHILRRMKISSFEKQPIWSNTQMGVPQGGNVEPSQEGPERQPDHSQSRNNMVIITPPNRRVPVNGVSYFSVRVNSSVELASLSISGAISGGNATIEELKTDFFSGSKVQTFQNASGNSFSMGYTFPPEGRVSMNPIAQLRIKFAEKGRYTISFSGISAAAKDQKPVNLQGNTAEIEVF